MKVTELFESLAPGQAAWKAEMTKKGAVKFKRDEHGGGAVDRIVAYNEAGKVVGGFNLKARVAEGVKDNSEKLATLKRRLRELTTDFHNMGYTFGEAERKLRVKQIKDEIAEIEAK
jgi:hypothetical protein